MTSADKRRLGLYLHIPFCLSKCAYCDFCSVAGSGNHARSVYVDALCREMSEMGKKAKGYTVDIANNKFGVEFASFDFMTDIIQSQRNIKLPMGAGAYKVTDADNNDKPSESSFL